MAEDYQSSPDERADDTPTPDELQAAELAKTKQALLVAAAMQQTESQLAGRLPTQPAPVQPPPQQPINLPVSQGRMYMGPSMTAPQEQAFMQSPSGTSTNLVPPPDPMNPDQQAALQGRVAAATNQQLPYGAEPPYSDASVAAQQNMMRYNAMKKFDAGERSPEVMAAAMGSRSVTTPRRYNVHGVGLVDDTGKVISPAPAAAQKPITVAGVGLVDPATGKVIAKAEKRDMVLEKAIADERAALNKSRAELAKTPPTSGEDPRIREAYYHIKKLKELTAQHQQSQADTSTGTTAPPPVQAPTPQGRPVKDKSGKTWIYTGNAADPKTDKDPSHWTAQ